MKKYLFIPTGFYWLQVVELRSNRNIEITSDLMEQLAPLLIDNNIGSYESLDNEFITEDNDSYIYLDLSSSKKDNCYMLIDNLKLVNKIPESYEIDLIIDIDLMEVIK